MMNKLHLLFSVFWLEYGVEMLLYRDFRGFDGCLKVVLGDVWSDKNKNGASYGTRPNRVPWTDREDMMVRK